MTPDTEKVALARAVLRSVWQQSNADYHYCRYCVSRQVAEDIHRPDCPVPIAQRVIAESEK
jgi:hypothetical protein